MPEETLTTLSYMSHVPMKKLPYRIMMATEMQIQVKLDSNGLTTWVREGQSVDLDSRKINNASDHQGTIDYLPKSSMTCLAFKHNDWTHDLLFDMVSVLGETREASCVCHSHLFFRLPIVD
jgi:hypothetical protein